jgi:CDP-diacylglycerol--serine O-phosphatidyltransferase
MIERFPARYLAPNAITAASLLLALVAIVQAAEGRFDACAWTIVWCVLLDRFDGFVARRLRACSEFGVQFDTLADLLAFGAAPALLMYFRLAPPGTGPVPALAAGLYLLAAALRLARFNVQAHDLGPDWSRGLTVTIAAAIVALAHLSAGTRALATPALLPGLLLLLAFLMVSVLWLPKALPLPPWARVLFALGVVLVYGLGALRRAPELLLALAVAYPTLGFLWGAWRPPRTPRSPHAHEEAQLT